MKTIRRSSCTLLLAIISFLRVDASPVEDLLARSTRDYEKKLETLIQPAHSKALADLDQHYRSALKNLMASASQPDAPAVQGELQRLDNGKPLPPDDSGLPASLTSLRGTYRKEVARLETERARKAAPVRQQFISQLQQLRIAAVKSSNADVALVDEKLAELGVSLPGAPKTRASDAAATQELLEWCIRQKAAVSYLDGPKIVTLDLISELPKTRVRIKTIRNIDPTGGRRFEAPSEPFPYQLLGKGAPEIELLHINSTERFGPANCKDIGSLQALQNIFLVLSAGTIADYEAMPTLPQVTHVEIRLPNSMPQEDQDALLITLLKRFPGTRFLYLGKHSSPAVAEALAAMRLLKQVHTHGDPSPGFWPALARCASLRRIMVFDTEHGPSADEIRQFGQLEAFVFHADVTDPEATSALASLPKLDCLTLSLKHQTPETIRKLASFPSLTWLRLRDVPAGADVLFETLGKMKPLKKLALQGPGVTASQIPKLSSLKNLEVIDVDQTHVGPEPLNALMRVLRKLKQVAKLGPWPS